MTTFDEAFPAAAKLLDERGLLLNAQLLRMVDGDDSLFRELREGLIFDGLAEDRFGVGLARIGPAGAKAVSTRTSSRTESRDTAGSLEITFAAATEDSLSDEPSQSVTTIREELVDADWWLMAGGVTRGPFNFAAMRVMRRRGEIAKMDLVRKGLRGQWQSPDDVAGLADVSDVLLPTPTEPPTPASAAPRLPIPVPSVPMPSDRVVPSVGERLVTPAAKQVEPSLDVIDDGQEYFLWEAGHPVGPISRGDLKARLNAGRLDADEFVQVGQDGEWQPVSRALSAQRPPMRLPTRAPNLSDVELDAEPEERDAARPSSSTPLPTNKSRSLESPSRAGAARSEGKAHTTEPSRAVASKNSPTPNTKPTSEGTRSSLGQTWKLVADLVGGERRLWAIVVSVAAVVALIVWWRQPPSASTIYREFAACHQKLNELRVRRAGPTDWSLALTRERPRIRLLMDGLKKRASAARPAEQELMWAGQYGLLDLLKNPPDATEFERLYTDHMRRAQRLIDPKGASATEGVSNKPTVSPNEIPANPTIANPVNATSPRP